MSDLSAVRHALEGFDELRAEMERQDFLDEPEIEELVEDCVLDRIPHSQRRLADIWCALVDGALDGTAEDLPENDFEREVYQALGKLERARLEELAA